MKIACLQFDSKLGAVEKNILRADSLLAEKAKGDFDLLVLPELAFTGYNFPSLVAISDFLEKAGRGPSSTWARNTALRLGCVVAVGYPEKETRFRFPLPPPKPFASISPEYDENDYNFNSVVVYSPSGQLIANYRKSFLYYTEATWAREGRGFSVTTLDGLPLLDTLNHDTTDGENLVIKAHARVSIGICMDMNPKDFDPNNNDKFEFATHVAESSTDLAILSMAWLSFTLTASDLQGPAGRRPDLLTWGYWFERFTPVLEREGNPVTFVMSNRCGIDTGAHSRNGALAKVYDFKIVEFVEAVRAGMACGYPETWNELRRTLTHFSVGGLSYNQMRDAVSQLLTSKTRNTLAQLFARLVPPEHQSSTGPSLDSGLHSLALETGMENAKLMATVADIIESSQGVVVPNISYVGSSMVWTASRGRITVKGFLGRTDEACLVVDTAQSSERDLCFTLQPTESSPAT